MYFLILLFHAFKLYRILQATNGTEDYDLVIQDYHHYLKLEAIKAQKTGWYTLYYANNKHFDKIKVDKLEKFDGLLNYNLSNSNFKHNKVYYIDYDKWKSKSPPYADLFNMVFKVCIKMGGTDGCIGTNVKYDDIYKNKNMRISFIIYHRSFHNNILYLRKNLNNFTFTQSSATATHGIIFLFKTQEKQISMMKMPYHNNYYLINGCPSVSLSNKYIVFELNPTVSSKGLKIDKYTLLPIYPIKKGSTFFKCGIYKQHKLPDIEIGFELEENEDLVKDYLKEKYDEVQSESCSINSENSVSFIYFEKPSDSGNKISFEKSGETANQKVFFGENKKKYTYSKDIISGGKNFYFDDEKVVIPNFCIQDLSKLRGTIKIMVMGLATDPTITNLDMDYYTIKNSDIEKKFTTKCTINVDVDLSLPNYFSKVVEYSMVKDTNKDVVVTDVTFKKNEYQYYGKYFCKIVKKEETFDEGLIKSKFSFFLPAEGTIFQHDQINVTATDHNLFNCSKTIGDIGNFHMIAILDNGIEKVSKTANQIDNENFINLEDTIIFKNIEQFSNVIVKCTYETIIKTKFEISKSFKVITTVTEDQPTVIPTEPPTTTSKTETLTTTSTTESPAIETTEEIITTTMIPIIKTTTISIRTTTREIIGLPSESPIIIKEKLKDEKEPAIMILIIVFFVCLPFFIIFIAILVKSYRYRKEEEEKEMRSKGSPSQK
uniref:6-cysteine protein n=1 Tax=Parastrongyloides trichosuri TaxID=131310 RepID=A0A0N4ZF21_PARTI